jgi:hypothetical protein
MQAKCNQCNSTFAKFHGYSRRELDGGIIEIGIECPKCRAWYHAHYLDHELEALQQQIQPEKRPPRKVKRAYARKFKKLQAKLRKRFGVEAPTLKGKQAA